MNASFTSHNPLLGLADLAFVSSLWPYLSRAEVIKANPIGKRLDAFRDTFDVLCAQLDLSSASDVLHEMDSDGNNLLVCRNISLTHIVLKNSVRDFMLALQTSAGDCWG